MQRRSPWGSFEEVTVMFIFLLLFNSIAICQGSAPTSQRSTDEQDIRETVLREQMEDWIRGGDKAEAEAKDTTEKAVAKMLNFKVFFHFHR